LDLHSIKLSTERTKITEKMTSFTPSVVVFCFLTAHPPMSSPAAPWSKT